MPSRSRVIPVLTAAFLLGFSTGCTAWRTVYHHPPADYLLEHHPKRVRLAVADSFVVVRNAHLSGDSVRGLAEREGHPSEPVSVRAQAVRRIAVRGPGVLPLGTAGVVVGAWVALCLAFALKEKERR